MKENLIVGFVVIKYLTVLSVIFYIARGVMKKLHASS